MKPLSLYNFLELHLKANPKALAVFSNTERYTYEQLASHVEIIAMFLNSLQLPPFSTVGFIVNNPLNISLLALAAMKTRHVFVTLESSDPPAVMLTKINLATIKHIITDAALVANILSAVPVTSLADIMLDDKLAASACSIPAQPHDPLYIIFTSGTTGEPKGVLLPHLAMQNRLAWMWRSYQFLADEVMYQKTSLTFVDSIWEIFGGLLQGIPTFYGAKEDILDPEIIVTHLKKYQVTRVTFTPSYIAQLLLLDNFNQDYLPKLRIIVLSGEPLLSALADKVKKAFPNGKLINLYGSSEVSGDVTYFEVVDPLYTAIVPLGAAIDHTQLFLLDADGKQVIHGAVGELYVAGANLALGYLNAEQTRERFVRLPQLHDGMLFKTGDLAFYADADLHYCGRIDRQLKFKGIRLEPAAIENVLLSYAGVELAATGLIDLDETPRLIVFLKINHCFTGTANAVKTYLRSKLPAQLVPDQIILLNSFPFTSTGKTNVAQLTQDYLRSLTPALSRGETNIKDIVQDVLQEVLKASIDDDANFFDAGVNSLISIRILARLRKRLPVKLIIQDIFKHASVSQLAAHIETLPIAGERV